MLDFIEGEIISKEPQRLVLRSGDLGFDIKVSNQTLSALPPQGKRVLVYTNLQIREDDISLYGFSTREERSFFDLLTQVSGVGPKLALAILSAYPVPTLKKAIVTGDLASLTSISGIGKKTAQRMVLELKDKLDKEMVFGGDSDGFGSVIAAGSDSDTGQAFEALEALGYTRGEIMRVFAGKDLAAMEVEAIIKLGLKELGRS
ncbi:MAG: Holliday junction branch migration protein RuvA [Peptococcaceae bacterium]|jgi:Holliday junction DNA helicase RuvA|nr:Holliday junction branch migration protein RuvA [Peptococcaceae bacterium]